MTELEPHYEIHGVIRAVFGALDEARINWLLFRGEERMQRPTGDIDLLIEPRGLDATDKVLTKFGFSRQGSELFVTRRAYVAYVAEDDLWLRFDVVTRVAFGELLEFDTGVAPTFLAAKHRVGVLYLPDRNDAFWHLLLHYLLDRGEIPLAWREVVRERANDARPDGPLAEFLDRLPGATSSLQLLNAARAADWPLVQRLCVNIRTAWLAAQAPRSQARLRAHKLAYRFGLSQWTSFRPGLSVAVLGPDGAGKTTLATGLRDSIAIPTKYVYMGLWKEGRLEKALAYVPGSNLLLLLIRLVARSARLAYFRWRGCIVILDRFTYDAVLVTENDSWRQRGTAALVLRMSQTPDLIIVLDLPGEVAFARKGEQDVATLNEWRDSYRALESGTAELVVVDATKSVEDVRKIATQAIWALIERRVGLKLA